MTAHRWEAHPEQYTVRRPFQRWRLCRNCGVEQRYECTGGDRLAGWTYGWQPRVGRCKPMAHGPRKQERR